METNTQNTAQGTQPLTASQSAALPSLTNSNATNVPGTVVQDKIPAQAVVNEIKPLQLPQQPTTGTAAALTQSATGFLRMPTLNEQNLDQSLGQSTAVAQQNAETAGKTYEEQVLGLLGQMQNRPGELQQQFGIQQLTNDYLDVKNKYDSTQLQYRRQKEAETVNPMLSAEQKSARIGEIERKEASHIADIAIDFNLKQGKLSSAKELMNQQLQLELEPMKLKVDYYKDLRNNYQNIFTDAQKRQLDRITVKEERAYREKIAEKELQNSMRLASYKASLDAKNAVNNSTLSPAMKLKIASNPQFQKVQAKISLSKALEEYKNQIDNFKATGVPLAKLGNAERRALRTTVDTVIGPSLNVAVGQGALSQDEADRILSKLTVNKIGGGSNVKKNADAILGAYKTINQSDLNTLDSLYPGIIDGIPEVAEYYYGGTSNQLSNDDLLNNINGALTNTTSSQVDNSQFFSNFNQK